MLFFTFLSMKRYGDGKPGRHLKGEHNKVMNRATEKEGRRKFQS